MANEKNFVLTDEERMYVVQALQLKLASARRAQNAQVSGSALHKAHADEIQRISAVSAKFGA